MVDEVFSVFIGLAAVSEDHKGFDGVPLHGVGFPMTAASATASGDERTLDLCSADVVPGGDNQIIGPPNDHDVTVLSFTARSAEVYIPDSVPALW